MSKINFTLDTGKKTAEKNMKMDEEFLESLENDPILHFYDWSSPSITHGYFIDSSKFLYMDALKKEGIEIARRPTGGGIVFHLWDLAFSFLLPSSHPNFSIHALVNYQFVHKIVLKALKCFFNTYDISLTPVDFSVQSTNLRNFCMARPTKYDLIIDGKKIAGAAQRKKRQGYLHQGTISLAYPDIELLRRVLKDPEVVDSMIHYTHAPLQNFQNLSLRDARQEVKRLLEVQFQKSLCE